MLRPVGEAVYYNIYISILSLAIHGSPMTVSDKIGFMYKSDWKIGKRLRSFGYAFKGIATLFSQPNACIHAVVMVIVLVCGAWFKIQAWEWCAVILCIGGVLMAETLNTAIEALCDKVSPGFDSLIGKAKDLAAGAVLLFVISAVVVGLIIFLPKFLSLF